MKDEAFEPCSLKKLRDEITGISRLCQWYGRMSGMIDKTEADRIPCAWNASKKMLFQIMVIYIFRTVLPKRTTLTKLEHIIRICFSRSAAAKNVMTFQKQIHRFNQTN